VPVGEREEPFEYYQEGRLGQGRRRVSTLDLGDGATMELVRIPAGTFRMGSPSDEDERLDDEDPHDVELARDLYIGKYEVTHGQFRAFVSDTGYRSDAETDGTGGWGYNRDTGKIEGRRSIYSWKFTGFDQSDDHPVVNVSWNDAASFCRWLAGRSGTVVGLPSEAEWEYACRAGSQTRFYGGNDPADLVGIANVADGTAKAQFPDWEPTIEAENGYVFSAPAGRFRPNRFGIYDMHGNVWEWCQDWYGPYAGLGEKDPLRGTSLETKSYRVMRGGGFGKRTPRVCSSARRVGGTPTSRDLDLGFRVARRDVHQEVSSAASSAAFRTP
jgi:formylglycine-generating enzyme required for sulfatase activity